MTFVYAQAADADAVLRGEGPGEASGVVAVAVQVVGAVGQGAVGVVEAGVRRVGAAGAAPAVAGAAAVAAAGGEEERRW